MIYFIQAGEYIKIGLSDNPKKRLARLQTANPNKLELLCTVEGGIKEEGMYHLYFEECRAHGEWFKDNEILQAVIGYIAENDAPPDDIAFSIVNPLMPKFLFGEEISFADISEGGNEDDDIIFEMFHFANTYIDGGYTDEAFRQCYPHVEGRFEAILEMLGDDTLSDLVTGYSITPRRVQDISDMLMNKFIAKYGECSVKFEDMGITINIKRKNGTKESL